MLNFKTVFVILVIVGVCCCQEDLAARAKKKKHHHHGLKHLHFLTYLGYLLVKVKIVFFLGTIFTIGVVAAKVFALVKYLEHSKHHHHEEKIVYSDPYAHHGFDYGGPGPGGYVSSKTLTPGDVTYDQPPPDGVYGGGGEEYGPPTGRDLEGTYGSGIYDELVKMANRMRQLNITDMALNEMGIKNEDCKRKFICKADMNPILKSGMELISDVSYERYKPNATITREEDCDKIHKQCQEDV